MPITRRVVTAGIGLVAAGGYVAARFMPEPPPPPLFAETLDRATLATLAIAPPGEAITFARVTCPDGLRLLRVLGWQEGRVRGVDLTAALAGAPQDPIALLAALPASTPLPDGPEVEIAATDLATPFDGHRNNIAIGGNYPAHGAEVALETPFVFPKRTLPTGPRGNVSTGDGLLDYEIELGIVFLDAHPRSAPVPARLGFVLVGDYTDRLTLMHEIDITDVESGHGFGSAKSRPGYLPVGPLLVVPRDPGAFLRAHTLALYVDGRLRQRAETRLLTWDLQRMRAEITAREAASWQVNGEPAGLGLEAGTIAPRTILLTGTPDGVVFRPPSARQISLGVVETAATLGLGQDGLFAAQVRESRADARYLQPGALVTKRADFLGVIENRIVA